LNLDILEEWCYFQHKKPTR